MKQQNYELLQPSTEKPRIYPFNSLLNYLANDLGQTVNINPSMGVSREVTDSISSGSKYALAVSLSLKNIKI